MVGTLQSVGHIERAIAGHAHHAAAIVPRQHEIRRVEVFVGRGGMVVLHDGQQRIHGRHVRKRDVHIVRAHLADGGKQILRLAVAVIGEGILDIIRADAAQGNHEEDAPVADNLFSIQDENSTEAPVDLGGDLFGEENNEQVSDNSDDLTVPVAEPSEEKPLFEDDDWLSDAPAKADDTTSADTLDDMMLISTNEAESEESAEIPDLDFGISENTEEENQINIDMPSVEKSEEAPLVMPEITPDIEETAQEESQPLNFDFGETEEESTSEEIDPESIGACASIDTMSFFPEEDNEETKEDISIPEVNTSEENQDAAEESQVFTMEETAPVEESINPVTFDEASPEEAEHEQEISFSFDNQEESVSEENEVPVANNISIENEETLPAAPVMNAVEEATPVKEAQEYKEDNTGRFGGITVTISRDEIMSMLGNAIDKYFLEEAVKEVIAANMKDIVRNIVPAIAEKYIKEEIERLKNDE